MPVVITSVLAYVVGRRVLGLPRATLAHGLARALECLGITALFLVIDTIIGAVVIIAVRTLTPLFVPLYVMADQTLMPLALLQGLAFWWWFRGPRMR
jgi:type IV secretory pathway VirB3-like protein